MKRTVSVALALSLVHTMAGCSGKEAAPSEAPGAYTAGTYTGVSPNGRGGEVKVEVVLSADRIESVTLLENNETAAIAAPAIETIPAQIMEHQSLGVDAVSGATITSLAILEAVADAVTQAGGDAEALKSVPVNVEKKDETVEMNATVVVVGGGAAGMAAAMSAAYEGGRKRHHGGEGGHDRRQRHRQRRLLRDPRQEPLPGEQRGL